MYAQRHKEATGKISYIFGIILIAVVGGLYGIIYAIDHTLPTPLELSDEVNNPDAFIAERARNYLKDLVKIGPRVTGHVNNEIFAVEYLIKTIKQIIDNKHINQKITYDGDEVQYSGSFFLDFKPNGAINVYSNIQNVVVKIHSKNDSPHSVLINTHFDTVPNSPGGSDDGINVAIALEIINKLSKLEEKPTHNIIFLFNGAEEAALCGSHAFITQHYLAEEVSVFINLEATGAGGKEILFQTGPNEPWLLKYYDVPHPHANAGAEEVFQSNIIPSDTDFRIFRDYGEIVGYDFAYYKDGYRYHTKYDLEENIDFGSFQHTGDNILHLVKNLAEANELIEPKTEGGKSVFYDVFGLFFLNYSMGANVIFQSLLALLSITLLIWACINVKLGNLKVSLLYITMLCFVILLGWFLATGIVLIVALILDATNRSMSWYSSPGIIFPLYVAPTFGSMLITTIVSNKVVRHKTLTLTEKVIMQVHVVRLIWTLPLIVTTVMELRIGIMFMFGVFFNSAAMLIIHVLDICKPKLTPKLWPIIYILSTIIPSMIIYLYAHQDVVLFTPIFGRFGSGLNPDILMSLFVASFTLLIGSYYIPLFTFIKKPWYVILVLASIFLAGIILAYTPVGFPYRFSESNPKLQRYSIYHTMRTIKDSSNSIIKQDTGFYFYKNDRNTPHSIEGVVSFMDKAISVEDDCEIALGCGLPITNSRNIKNIENSVWIPAKEPPFPWSPQIDYKITSDELTPKKKQFSVEIQGSDKIDVYLSIRKGFKLIQLSLVEEIPSDYIEWNDQVTYYLAFVYGKTKTSFSFYFIVETETDFKTPSIDLAITTKFVHDDSFTKTSEYKEFLAEFPEWTAITVSGSARYENIVLT